MTTTLQVDGTGIEITGSGRDAIVFVHGWPDTAQLWDAQVAALRHEWRCVRFTLPGFERPSRGPYAHDEVVEHLRRIVEHACPGERVTLVLHDWGGIFGWWLAARHPQLVSRLVFVDLGDGGSSRHRQELGLPSKLATAAYQLWLASAWRIGGRVGDAMSRAFARAIRAPTDPQEIHAGMAYPYAVLWFGVKGGMPRPRPALPDVPVAFIYGERKPFMLHSRAWEREIASRPENAVVALDAGHWLMVTHADAFNEALAAWLRRTGSGPR